MGILPTPVQVCMWNCLLVLSISSYGVMSEEIFELASHVWFSGELAVQNILESALKAAERCADPEDREAIIKAVSNIRAMTAALNEVKAKVCVF